MLMNSFSRSDIITGRGAGCGGGAGMLEGGRGWKKISHMMLPHGTVVVDEGRENDRVAAA